MEYSLVGISSRLTAYRLQQQAAAEAQSLALAVALNSAREQY